jgi:opacity protein-like surface antigen
MKKLLCILVLVSTCIAHGQDWRYGAKFGGSLGMNTVEFPDQKSPVLGFQLGLQAEYQVTTQYSIQAELFYARQGAQSEVSLSSLSNPLAGTVSFFNAQYDYSFQMLQLPIFVKLYATPQLFIEFGPQISYLTQADVTYRYESSERTNGALTVTEADAATLDYTDNLNKINFHLNLGIGYDFNENMYFNARFVYGINNMASQSDQGIGGVTSMNENLRAHAFQVGLGYRF